MRPVWVFGIHDYAALWNQEYMNMQNHQYYVCRSHLIKTKGGGCYVLLIYKDIGQVWKKAT